ncbi:hypothetical protein [Antrihabitans stalactiti]|uniref:Uncharacterized protein n=1 Tax=Antrihabitans stalactiti TaxID=2584121 RepID=A0A848K4S4_9NOCA|nr:hypothetical protein [Antrihabitans stalactiti]NMN93703.1 hypothetical protein [Antrihabitans stalactiti]
MFDIGGSFLPQSISLLDHMATASVAENKAAHAKITAAGHFWSDWIERDAELATGELSAERPTAVHSMSQQIPGLCRTPPVH